VDDGIEVVMLEKYTIDGGEDEKKVEFRQYNYNS
jgi:hypothetical protein